VPVQQDPLRPDNHCTTGALDSDGDGLNDCEEALLQTMVNNPDSDNDGLPDSVEVALGSSPLNADPGVDTDLDNIPDMAEVLLHLPARTPNTGDDKNAWGYVYQASKVDDPSGMKKSCYNIGVSNLSMAETMAGGDRPAGANVVHLIATFSTGGPHAKLLVLQATMHGVFHRPDIVAPSNGTFSLVQADFGQMK
jgi:hypothetical protein